MAAMFFEQKKPDEALARFHRALELNPRFANALYGKSMVLMTEGRFAEALACLDQLFRQGDLNDARVQPMLEAARDNYRKLANIVANDKASETFKAVENLKAMAVAESGFEIVVAEQKLEGTLCAVTQMAWKYRRDYHQINLQSQLPAEMVKHHILAHEAWHVILESRARKAGVNQWFVTEDAKMAAVVDSMKSDIRRIARTTGHDETGLRKLAGQIIRDALSLLYNAPLDMLIETKLATIPEMREAQFCSLLLQTHNAASVGLDKRSRSIVPGSLLKMNDALNGAMALFVDELSGGATVFFAQYEDTGRAKLARSVHDLCKQARDEPGAEYRLVDSVAELLGRGEWFGWKDDPGEFEIVEKLAHGDMGGVTNPSLLKKKSSEAVPFLLSALRRFGRMENEAIKKLTMEAALLGQEGLDYSDKSKHHRLKALPGESLSGLEVMCILYAGLKRIAPADTNLGMDLNDEFAMALELYQSEKER